MKIFGGMRVLSLVNSYVVCMWVTLQYVVLMLFALCLLLFLVLQLPVLSINYSFYDCFLVFVCFGFYSVFFVSVLSCVYFGFYSVCSVFLYCFVYCSSSYI